MREHLHALPLLQHIFSLVDVKTILIEQTERDALQGAPRVYCFGLRFSETLQHIAVQLHATTLH